MSISDALTGTGFLVLLMAVILMIVIGVLWPDHFDRTKHKSHIFALYGVGVLVLIALIFWFTAIWSSVTP